MRSSSVGRPLAPSRTESESEIESMIDLGSPHFPADSPLPRRINLRPPSPVRVTPPISGVAPTRTTVSSGPSHGSAGPSSSLHLPGGFVNPQDLLMDPTTVLLDSRLDARPMPEHGAPSGNPAPFGLNESTPGLHSSFGGVPAQGGHALQTQAWSPLEQTMADSEYAGYPPVPDAQWDAAVLTDPMWGMATMAASGVGPQGYGNPQGYDNPQAPFGLNESAPGLHPGFGGVPAQGGHALQTQAWSPLEQTMADSEYAGYPPVPHAQWNAALSDPARKRKADKKPPDGPPTRRVARGAGEAQSSRAGGIRRMSAQSVERSGAPTVELSETQKRKIQKNGGQAAIVAAQAHAHALMAPLQAGGLGLSAADIVKIAAHHGGAGTLETLTKNDCALVKVLMAEPLKLEPEAIVNIARFGGASDTLLAVATLPWRDSMGEVQLLTTVCRNSGSKALRKALAS